VRSDEQRVDAFLARAESWAEARVMATVAAAADGLTAEDLARTLKLPRADVLAIVERLQQLGTLERVSSQSDELPCFRLSAGVRSVDEAPARATIAGVEGGNAAAGQDDGPASASKPRSTAARGLDPSPGAEGRDSRQVASDVTALYRRLFQRSPSLAWLLRQRRRAMELGEEFAQLLAAVHAARPSGNPQAYLEAMLKRMERERGVSSRGDD
jgi:hypothetical protein